MVSILFFNGVTVKTENSRTFSRPTLSKEVYLVMITIITTSSNQLLYDCVRHLTLSVADLFRVIISRRG